MFPSPLTQCFSLKRRLFCENQPIFVVRLPIKFFYFEDFRWQFFGKIIGQKQLFPFLSSSSFFIALALLLTQKHKDDFSSQTTVINCVSSHRRNVIELFFLLKNDKE